MKIGFIGTGLMGNPMALNVLKKYSLNVYNRTREKASNIIEAGGIWLNNPTEISENSDIVIIMLSDDSACDLVLYGEDGIFNSKTSSPIIVNMSTITPQSSIKFSNDAKKKGIQYVEAPVAGTTGPAREGTLKIFFGGSKEILEKIRPLLDTMGDKIMHMGEVGSAAKTKLLINANLAVQMAILSETVYLAEINGLDPSKFLELIQNSAVGTIVSKFKGLNILNRSYPVAFPLELLVKDLKYGSTLGKAENTILIDATRLLYEKGLTQGLSRKDFSSVYEIYKNS